MVSKRSSSKKESKTKIRSRDGSAEGVKHSSSDATINNERMFGDLEELMTYIGSSYPHYRKTVFPLILTSSFLFLTSRFITEMGRLKELDNTNYDENHEYFYSKCHMNEWDNAKKVAKNADFMPEKVPKWELSIVMNAILMFSTTTVSPRRLALISMTMVSISYFAMAHFPQQTQMSMFVSQVFTEIYRMVAMVTIAESVPKFHRMPALVLLEFAAVAARTIANIFVRLPADVSIDMSYCFEIFGFGTVVMSFVTYYTFHDSLYSLLARSKTDQMQSRVTAIFAKAQITLAADAVIDQIAFENFENNQNPIEILARTLKTFKLLQEVLVCGVISGACLLVNAFMQSELTEHSEIMFFETTLIPTVAYTASGVILIVICILLPRHRVLPVIVLIPVLFCAASAMLLIPRQFRVYDKCTHHWVVEKSVRPAYFGAGVLVSSISHMIRFFVRVHLLEVMPVLIRTAVIAILYFLQFSFDGNVRDLYSHRSIDGFFVLMMITMLSMLVLLINPRKKNYMNVFFCEYTSNDKKKSIPPAPEFEKVN